MEFVVQRANGRLSFVLYAGTAPPSVMAEENRRFVVHRRTLDAAEAEMTLDQLATGYLMGRELGQFR